VREVFPHTALGKSFTFKLFAMKFDSRNTTQDLCIDNDAAQREPDLSAIRWSRLLGTDFILVFSHAPQELGCSQ